MMPSSGCKIEENIAYDQNDIVVHGTRAFPHGTNSAKNRESCADLCASTEGCFFWTWTTKGDLCWIKNSKSGREVNVGAVSGNKKCGVDKTQHHYPILTGQSQSSKILFGVRLSFNTYIFSVMRRYRTRVSE